MWLLGRLTPHHKSIAEFRRMHRGMDSKSCCVAAHRLGLKCAPMLEHFDWIKLYRAALHETDPAKQAHIEEAKNAIKQGLGEQSSTRIPNSEMPSEPSRKYSAELTIYAAASGFVESCFLLSFFKANFASSSCKIRAVWALWRMCVNNAPSAIPNISIPSNNRTSGGELINRRNLAVKLLRFSTNSRLFGNQNKLRFGEKLAWRPPRTVPHLVRFLKRERQEFTKVPSRSNTIDDNLFAEEALCPTSNAAHAVSISGKPARESPQLRWNCFTILCLVWQR